jgi:hypothetical protein
LNAGENGVVRRFEGRDHFDPKVRVNGDREGLPWPAGQDKIDHLASIFDPHQDRGGSGDGAHFG